jgi:putative spermidine/putrescine transport system substrate-binding protein
VDNKIRQGIFPGSAKSFVFKSGTIQNSHYLGIPSHTPQAAGALAVANFLISPEAQLRKLQPSVWGDGTVLDISRLPEPWRSSFQALPERKNALPRSVLQTVALQEPAPEYMLRLSEDFRKKMLQ